ncbi:CAP-Gly domain-containing linker protein 4-like [Physeter macrocephalus]|uniref:CAP-Gly domain-containing linker protein 4-like n=1 Tax=Physeter macrocephalus TaxID=9755 RepID=A0A455BTY9_PHYMC|nr:CAP-Gly domain-containing linker protein 4-like [Physeter catodon]|eukprot:XP_028352450.1 CAP-Gly domain-containing linker protein 4-like [Physeter catodon]
MVNCVTWLSCLRVCLAFPLHRSKPALRRSWSSSTTAGGLEGSVRLHEGSQVLLTSSNEMGTVRYLGPTDFASGIWLGLELRSAKGKNDGAVGDKRYFTCRPNHGVLNSACYSLLQNSAAELYHVFIFLLSTC